MAQLCRIDFLRDFISAIGFLLARDPDIRGRRSMRADRGHKLHWRLRPTVEHQSMSGACVIIAGQRCYQCVDWLGVVQSAVEDYCHLPSRLWVEEIDPVGLPVTVAREDFGTFANLRC